MVISCFISIISSSAQCVTYLPFFPLATIPLSPPSPYPSILQAAGAKVLGGDSSRARRTEDLKTEASRLEMSIVAAKAEYERIKEANLQVCG